MNAEKKQKNSAADAEPSAKEIHSFQIVEAYKALRTNLLFSLAATESKSVVISSAESGAGKSTTCANLAIVMAQTNLKVLLIDADMRKPALDRIFKVSRREGLSKAISGMTDFETAVTKGVAPNLDLMTAGPTTPSSQELLASEGMARVLHRAEELYDYIIIDTPPINLMADALVLVKQTVGIMLVVRERSTHHGELRRAEDAVRQIGGNLLGVLLTDVRFLNRKKRDKYYMNYHNKAPAK